MTDELTDEQFFTCRYIIAKAKLHFDEMMSALYQQTNMLSWIFL